ncbi:hypothetical protein B4Q13_16440 [Lacticaseibacillus rhamnosus]
MRVKYAPPPMRSHWPRNFSSPINVTFDRLPGDVNHVGVRQLPCTLCGDWVTGCNYGSRLIAMLGSVTPRSLTRRSMV